MSIQYYQFKERERVRHLKQQLENKEENEIKDLIDFFNIDPPKEEILKEEIKNEEISNINNSNVILPIYLQKKIIRILCDYINNNCKNQDFTFFYEKSPHNHQLLLLEMTISLVNWLWFNTMSNYLNVQTTFKKGNNNKYRLVKDENIQTLILSEKYSINYQNQVNLRIDKDNMKDLKRIIIPNTFQSELNFNWGVINNIKRENYEKEIKLDLYINLNYSDFDIIELRNDLKISLLNISINCDIESNKIINFITNLNPTKLSILPVVHWKFPIDRLFRNNGDDVNIMIKCFDYQEVITVRELVGVLDRIKGQPLKKLSFEMCFDNLLYQMTGGNEGFGKCECCTISQRDLDCSFDQFKQYWEQVCELLSSFKSLYYLSISNSCRNTIGSEYDDLEMELYDPIEMGGIYSRLNKNFPLVFVDNMCTLINSCKYLTKFESVGFHTCQIFDSLIRKYGNRSIVDYFSTFSIEGALSKWRVYKEEINEILKEFNHIVSFKLQNARGLNDFLIDF